MKKILLFLFFFFVTFINVKAADYITSIKIDDSNLEGFTSDKYDYVLNVDSSKTSIKIGYVYDTNAYQGSGSIGTVNLDYGENILQYTIVNNSDSNDSKTYTIKVNRPDTRSSDNSLTSLTVGNQKVVLTDSNEYNISVDGNVKSIEIKATPASGAVLIDGYGERLGNNAVPLNNERTTVEVRVKAENESIRNYKINITKTNLKSNDATLKSLKIDGLDFEFKSDQLEYNLSVKYNVTKLKIEAIKNNEKANLEYTEQVTLTTGINNIDIKVTAEDGSAKIYKLNITREEEVPIVKDIKITGIDFTFKPKTYNYRIETSLSKLNFDVTLSNEDGHVEITGNEQLKNGSIIKIEAKDNDETVTYSFRIVNKKEKEEDKLIIETDGNKGNFFKDNEMIIGLSIFGIGILFTLISILVKRKSKIM